MRIKGQNYCEIDCEEDHPCNRPQDSSSEHRIDVENIEVLDRFEIARRRRPVPLFLTCVSLAALAPFLVAGPWAGKWARQLPSIVPPVRWGWTESMVLTPHLHLVSSQQRLAYKHKYKQIAEGGLGSNETAQVNPTDLESAEPPRSIWTFGPFVMSVGILASIILKLLCAPYFAKCFTDILRSLLLAQIQDDDVYRRSIPRQPVMQEASVSSPPIPVLSAPICEAAPSGAPPRASTSPRKSGRWPCSLDLPETPARASVISNSVVPPVGPPGLGIAGAEDRGSKRVTFSHPEETGPSRPPSLPGAEAIVEGALHPALQKAAASGSTFGRMLRQEISRHNPASSESGGALTATAAAAAGGGASRGLGRGGKGRPGRRASLSSSSDDDETTLI